MKRRARIGQNGKCRGRWYDKRCVGADAHIGPHDRRIWFFGVIFSGSGAGAKTILLRNERGNLTRTCGMQSRSHIEHSAPGGEGTGGSFRCFCLLLSLLTKVGRAGARNIPIIKRRANALLFMSIKLRNVLSRPFPPRRRWRCAARPAASAPRRRERPS